MKLLLRTFGRKNGEKLGKQEVWETFIIFYPSILDKICQSLNAAVLAAEAVLTFEVHGDRKPGNREKSGCERCQLWPAIAQMAQMASLSPMRGANVPYVPKFHLRSKSRKRLVSVVRAEHAAAESPIRRITQMCCYIGGIDWKWSTSAAQMIHFTKINRSSMTSMCRFAVHKGANSEISCKQKHNVQPITSHYLSLGPVAAAIWWQWLIRRIRII